MAKVLITVNDPPYGTERAYNAFRLAANILKNEPETELRIFLVGDAAACAKAGQSVPTGYYNIENMLKAVVQRNGVVGVCGTCMNARGINDAELVEGTRRSSLDQWTEWAIWAEKTLVF
ncbi:MAG: DsrE/DsrF/TusD sulfur relay family protein [Thermoplasmata archaeon]